MALNMPEKKRKKAIQKGCSATSLKGSASGICIPDPLYANESTSFFLLAKYIEQDATLSNF